MPGKERKIKGELLEKLSERLKEPKGFNSYGEIQEGLPEKQGEIVKYKTVHKTVRYTAVFALMWYISIPPTPLSKGRLLLPPLERGI